MSTSNESPENPKTPEPTGPDRGLGCGVLFFGVMFAALFAAMLISLSCVKMKNEESIKSEAQESERKNKKFMEELEASKKATYEQRKAEFASLQKWMDEKGLIPLNSKKYWLGDESFIEYYEDEIPEPIIKLIEEIKEQKFVSVLDFRLCRPVPITDNLRGYALKRCRVLKMIIFDENGDWRHRHIAAWNSKNPHHFAIGDEAMKKLLDEYSSKATLPEEPK